MWENKKKERIPICKLKNWKSNNLIYMKNVAFTVWIHPNKTHLKLRNFCTEYCEKNVRLQFTQNGNHSIVPTLTTFAPLYCSNQQSKQQQLNKYLKTKYICHPNNQPSSPPHVHFTQASEHTHTLDRYRWITGNGGKK